MVNLLDLTNELYDSHCHLNVAEFDMDRTAVVNAAIERGVDKIVDIGVGIAGSKQAIENAREFPGMVFATVGVDMEVLIPGSDMVDHALLKMSKQEFWERVLGLQSELDKLVQQHGELIVGIGETGIDAHHLTQALQAGSVDKSLCDLSLQRQEQLFRAHLELAAHWDLPLSVHSRAAEGKCLEIVQDYPQVQGIFHSYTGDYEMAKKVLAAGWGLGINGIITFGKSAELREVYRKILGKVNEDWAPKDFYERGVYLETDAPFLAPQGKRGERNTPGNVLDVYQFLVRELSLG